RCVVHMVRSSLGQVRSRDRALLAQDLRGQEERWAERRLKGFAEVREVLEKMLLKRYAPRTQTLTHKS
ncbi:MAG: hypothetical protein P3W93_000105, partial [Thermus sp.]|nr:hypothetical protein [Thermus sp.]